MEKTTKKSINNNYQTDCAGKNFPVFALGYVTRCEAVESASPKGSVYLLEIALAENAPLPRAGQFYMLRAEKSGTLLARPISVFHVAQSESKASVQFLILVKGQGSRELCSLRTQDKVQMLGPLGNGFALEKAARVCLVGGGIGVAPVAGFAETLIPESYDFFASFKSGSYGLDYIKPATLTITTDDGSVGIHGMLPTALTADNLRQAHYDAVYACGPTPMLRYVKNICEEANVKCYISMESRMACGVGACLGCTIETADGYKRCCKDGPVFDASILMFENDKKDVRVDVQENIRVKHEHEHIFDGDAHSRQNVTPPKNASALTNSETDLSIDIAGVRLINPVIAASGTFGYGTEYSNIFDVNKLGGIASKGLTLEARQGNSGIRLWETPSGLINSIGLQNPGIEHFIKYELPQMLSLKPVTIVNLSGSTMETYVEGAKLLDKTAAPLIELNISCPNVLDGGAIWGCDCDKAASVVRAVRASTTKPLIVKLTPQAANISEVAISCIEAGANAISLCNTFSAVAIDIERARPVFDNVKAGLSGPAVRPIAVRLVYDTAKAIRGLPQNKQVPIVAIGGIATWQDAVEFIMAGATAIQVGAATFSNPFAMTHIIEGLQNFMQCKGYKSIAEMCGIAQI